MSSRRAVRLVVVIATVAAVLPWQVTPAVAFTEGPDNNFFGTGAGAGVATTGAPNDFFGGGAGGSTTSGSSNAFFGNNAGTSNTTGSNNAFFGRSAGALNISGVDNSLFGAFAGFDVTGSRNAFFGRDAGTNSTEDDNAFFGAFAGANNTTGNSNAFFGSNAGRANTIGPGNSFFGRDAGLANTAGISNSFFGAFAGDENTSGFSNSFVGGSAGGNNTIGDLNSFFGLSAGLSNTTENGNSFLGSLSNGVAGITNATALGHEARVDQSNSLVLGSIAGLNGATSNVRIGIGTPTPADALHVRRTDGTAKVLVEEASAELLGRELFELVNNGASRFRVRNTSNNATWDFQSSSNAGSFVIDRVGGPVSLDFELQPDGDAVFRGTATATSFITSSDRNLKTDITPANARKLMTLLRRLDISTWRFKIEPEGTVNLGPMAQDFHRLFGMGTETTIDIRDLAALALVAAQEQQKEIDELKRAVAKVWSSR